jgi:glycosyltransferase involved in cell wall biosynthesis
MTKTPSPLFSVIIPAYNASRFIRNTLDSVRNQTFDDYEIIVVNDGSKDDTLEAVKAYFTGFPGLNYKIINQENRGIGGARNSGIKEAHGEFVAFLDADDNWYNEKLERVKEFIDKNTNVDLVCHNENWVENGRIYKEAMYGPYKTYKELLFKGNCISTSATVVRRSKQLEAGLFSENMDFNGAEDYELWLRLSKICKITYLNETLGEYHIHGRSETSNIEIHNRNWINVLEYHFDLWPNKTIYYKYMMCIERANAIRCGGRMFLRAGNFALAKSYLFRSLLLNPFSVKAWVLLSACMIRIKL